MLRGINVEAEQHRCWDKMRFVLLHEPGVETLFGMLDPQSCYHRPFDLTGAKWEHQNLRFFLEARGVRVIDIREALVFGCTDIDGRRKEGEALKNLRDATLTFLRRRISKDVTKKEKLEIEKRTHDLVQKMHPEVLAEIILLGPEISVIRSEDRNALKYGQTSQYRLAPSCDLMFLRDAMFTTSAGAVIGRAKSGFKDQENDIVELALKQIGIRPTVRVNSPGHIEGGDFLPAGDFVLQGKGYYSNLEGITQVLDAGGYGDTEVAVVNYGSKSSLHLCDYMTLLDRHHAVVSEDLIEGEISSVEVYQSVKRTDEICYEVADNLDLVQYLEKKDISLYRIKNIEGCNCSNFLMVDGREAVTTSQAYRQFGDILESNAVSADELDMQILNRHDGPGSLCQVLYRES